MKCRWGTTCAKCDTPILMGEDMKPQYRRTGIRNDGRPAYVRVPKQYVHMKCPKVTPNRPGQRFVDPRTGEIFDNPPPVDIPVESSPLPRHAIQETLPL